MKLLRAALLVLLAVSVLIVLVYARDRARAYERIAMGSHVMNSPFGTIEFAQDGNGPPVLVIHGSGGGHDQGRLIAETVLGEGFRWIAPSRFGYLRSAMPADASFDLQARAYVHLLDHLALPSVAVVALSHGGPSALLLAALHPERVRSLTLISCGVAASIASTQALANRKGNALTTLFQYDLLYWIASKLLQGQFMALMGADDGVVSGLTEAQRQLVVRVIDEMNPASSRALGVAFDNTAALPNERISAIRAPTLILHAVDDRLQLFHNAEFAAKHIPGAQLRHFARGGHLVFALEHDAIRAETRRFISSHPDE